MRIKIAVEQGGAVLSQAKVHIDSSTDLPAAIKAQLENVPWEDHPFKERCHSDHHDEPGVSDLARSTDDAGVRILNRDRYGRLTALAEVAEPPCLPSDRTHLAKVDMYARTVAVICSNVALAFDNERERAVIAIYADHRLATKTDRHLLLRAATAAGASAIPRGLQSAVCGLAQLG